MKKKIKVISRDMAIARLRKLQGSRTLREFADELKISYQYLAEMYSGRRRLGDAVLRHLRLEQNPPAEITYIPVRRRK